MSQPANPLICIPKLPTAEQWPELAKQAKAMRPDNVPEGLDLTKLDTKDGGRLAVDIRLRWAKTGVKLTVGFLDNPEAGLRSKILAHMNMWSKTANVAFVESATDPDVRIARVPGDGYWSWMGIDIRNHAGKPTMNLDGFTINTPDSEFKRVVCHETGHTLGFPHEHLRQEFVARLDRAKTIQHFKRTQGWSEQDVIYQVLTPLESSSIMGTSTPDSQSIMCYHISGECTIDGNPIIGGTQIDDSDYEFARRVYPKSSPAANTSH